MSDLAPEEFVWCRSVRALLTAMWRLRGRVRAILAMSDIEALIAACVTRLYRVRWPVVLGVFHPKQWSVTLDAAYAPHKARVFSRFLEALPPENVVSSSQASIDSCAKQRAKFARGCRVVSFPVPLPGKESPCVRRAGNSVVTVGRYVDFKVCTIFAMIDVVEKLNDGGRKVEYYIHGEGPSEAALRERIEGSRWRTRLHLHGALAQQDYRSAMQEHTVFFGMGSAVFQAGVAGIPAIIAIQGEATASCYGLLVDHHHGANPVFGDPTPGLRVFPLEQTLTRVLDLGPAEWKSLAEESRRVAIPYTGPQLLAGIREALAGAKWVSGGQVSVPDLARIRLETYYARFRRKPGIHV